MAVVLREETAGASPIFESECMFLSFFQSQHHLNQEEKISVMQLVQDETQSVSNFSKKAQTAYIINSNLLQKKLRYGQCLRMHLKDLALRWMMRLPDFSVVP